MIIFIIVILLVVCVILVCGYYIYARHVYNYWKRRGVSYIQPSFPFGNIGDLIFLRQDFGKLFKQFHESHNGDMIGFFMLTRPTLLIKSPELLKKILIKDFEHFVDRGFYVDERKDPCSATLFTIDGQKWRSMRNKISPAFTSGKLKVIFNTVNESGKALEKYLGKIIDEEGVEEIEIREITARFLTDLIASVGFGIEVDSLNNSDHMFRKMGAKVFKSFYAILVSFMLPSLLKIIHIRQTPIDLEKFMLSTIRDTVEYREQNNIKRDDFLQIMIQLRHGMDVDKNDLNADIQVNGGIKNLTIAEITSQCFIFFAAGFETSSMVMSFCMYELAKNLPILREVQEEIDMVLQEHDGKLTYESIAKLTKLDNCIEETERMYPPSPNLFRICTKDYKIPDTDIIIEKGTNVFVSLLGIHNDPNIYPDPRTFDPTRFEPENKNKRSSMDYMPFGDGPRNCVAMRLGKMNTKMGMVSLLSKFDFRLGTGMTDEIVMDPKNILTFPEGGIRLKISKRKSTH